jgi:type VI secretion system protein ImpC
MKYALNFGRLSTRPPNRRHADDTFRIAVLGDFSGRSNAGKVEAGTVRAARPPHRVDVDNFAAVARQWKTALTLPVGASGELIAVNITSLEDFHPDNLFRSLPIFQELSSLRRRLKNNSTFPAAASEVQTWARPGSRENTAPAGAQSNGSAMPAGTLNDFARLLGRAPSPMPRESAIDQLIQRVVGPYIVPATHPDQAAMVAAVDEALSATMCRVLHHPDFQALESLWRSIDLLTRQLETSGQLQIVLYDVTAQDVAADLSSTDTLDTSGLYQLLVEKPATDQRSGPLSVLVGNFIFDLTTSHAELLGRIGKLAAAAGAPFIAGVGTDCLVQREPDEIHPRITESWTALRQMPQAAYLGLTVPRFMLRWPYGAVTEPIESFQFEEFTPEAGLRSMLWANGSILAGLLLGTTFTEQGLAGMKLGSQTTLGDVPFYYYTDSGGDQVALPSTERNISEPVAVHIMSQNFMPVIAMRGRPEVRLGSFQSLSGALLAGPWAPVETPPEPAIDDRDFMPRATAEALLSAEEQERREAAEAEQELDALVADDSPFPADYEDELNDSPNSAAQEPSEQPPSANDGMDPELAALLDSL